MTHGDTRYASGSGSGDALYGYTTTLGRRRLRIAHSTFPLVYQKRLADVDMVSGHRLVWQGDPGHGLAMDRGGARRFFPKPQTIVLRVERLSRQIP